MYENLKFKINLGGYKLSEILDYIEELYQEQLFGGEGLTKEQRDELKELARKNADPTKEVIPAQDAVNQLAEDVKGLLIWKEEAENKTLDADLKIEYKDLKPPYNICKAGDVVIFEGKKYRCNLDLCPWSPAQMPTAWDVVSVDDNTPTDTTSAATPTETPEASKEDGGN